MSNVKGMGENINLLLSKIRFAILKETIDFCDTVNVNIPESERGKFCNTCKYRLLCDAIDSQIYTLRNFEFLIDKEI